MKRMISTCAVVALAMMIQAAAASAEPGSEREGRRRNGAPPEAMEACSDLAAGEACSFVTPRGHDLGGTCRERRDGLACVPERPPLERRGGRPDEEDDEGASDG